MLREKPLENNVERIEDTEIQNLNIFSHCFSVLSQAKFNNSTLYQKKKKKNIMGKGENAGNQHFLLFPIMFSTLPKINLTFSST